MTVKSNNPETMMLHAGPRNDASSGAVAMPIYQTTSYQFRSTEHAANLFALKDFGNIYSRIMNPTCDALEQKITALEGGVAALAVSSGQAASAWLSRTCAGRATTSSALLTSTEAPGICLPTRCRPWASPCVSPTPPIRSLSAGPRMTAPAPYYAETLPNPKLTVFPIGEVAAIGRELGVPLIMDNTAAPIICRPLEHGAAIVVHSTTKYIGGHGTSIGGMIVDGGNFDWAAHAKRFPMFSEPEPSYHGAIWNEAVKPMGPIAYIIRARVVLLRDIGSSMSPFNAFQFIQGLETLPLRMREHCRNASEVALYLQRHAAVSRVIYAGMHENAEQRRRTRTYLKGGLGGLVGFELKAGREAGARFIDALKMFYHVANIGDARSLAIHPASTTHSQLSPADQIASGVTPGYVRLSVGIEHIDDIIADLDQALAAATVSTSKAA
jgi:O-acetylhomoserine (thiol)-lyase